MLKRRIAEVLLACVFLAALGGARLLAGTAAADDAATTAVIQQTHPPGATATTSGDNFDFFSDKPVVSTQVVKLPPQKSRWLTVGGPLALIAFFFLIDLVIWRLVPFSAHSIDINLRDLPPAAKRGIAMAVAMFGIAFCFGASEIWYQLSIYGSAEAFFAQMSLGQLIVMTHAHLFGFTTSFFMVGIPFSIQFNQLKVYQWVFPVGLTASVTDVISWWGIKFVSPNFEWVSIFCGVLFSVSYAWMLIGLLRVLLFPEVIWASDKDGGERRAIKDAAQRK